MGNLGNDQIHYRYIVRRLILTGYPYVHMWVCTLYTKSEFLNNIKMLNNPVNMKPNECVLVVLLHVKNRIHCKQY